MEATNSLSFEAFGRQRNDAHEAPAKGLRDLKFGVAEV